MDVSHDLFDQIINIENLFLSWLEFRKGKANKIDVQIFERNLEDNLFKLHWELKNNIYRHQPYKSFTIYDPKIRVIHKATVRDRIVHHAVFRILYPVFDPYLMPDSYSCRVGKGTHKAVERLDLFIRNVSRNYQQTCYALKCDIQKFFASVDHEILKKLLARRISDRNVLELLSGIISSFTTQAKIGAEALGGGER